MQNGSSFEEVKSISNFVDLSILSSMTFPGMMSLVSSLVLFSQDLGESLKQHYALPLMHKWFFASHSYCKKVAWGMERAGYQESNLTFGLVGTLLMDQLSQYLDFCRFICPFFFSNVVIK